MSTSMNKKRGSLDGSAIGSGIAIGGALDAEQRKHRSNASQGHEHGSDEHTTRE